MSARARSEICAELDALHDATEAKIASLHGLRGDAQETVMQEIRDCNAKRYRLEAELVEARAIDEQTPSLFVEADDYEPPFTAAEEGRLSALADYYDEEARR